MTTVYIIFEYDDDGDVETPELPGWNYSDRIIDVYSSRESAISAIKSWADDVGAKVTNCEKGNLEMDAVRKSTWDVSGRTGRFILRKEVKP